MKEFLFFYNFNFGPNSLISLTCCFGYILLERISLRSNNLKRMSYKIIRVHFKTICG